VIAPFDCIQIYSTTNSSIHLNVKSEQRNVKRFVQVHCIESRIVHCLKSRGKHAQIIKALL